MGCLIEVASDRDSGNSLLLDTLLVGNLGSSMSRLILSTRGATLRNRAAVFSVGSKALSCSTSTSASIENAIIVKFQGPLGQGSDRPTQPLTDDMPEFRCPNDPESIRRSPALIPALWCAGEWKCVGPFCKII
jgi:hypothetical protein